METFLQSNFRFVVGSHLPHLARFEEEPSRAFAWEDVLQVETTQAAHLQCPISLDAPPSCPSITACGHVFSLPALVQHLVHAGGEGLTKAAPCPLCHTPVRAAEIRPLAYRLAADPAGASIVLQLWTRREGCILPRPVGGALQGKGEAGVERVGHLFCNVYSKFVPLPDPSPVWAEEVDRLAAHVAHLMCEGDEEDAGAVAAAYVALDALANRAALYAERRSAALFDDEDLDGVPGAAGLALASPPLGRHRHHGALGPLDHPGDPQRAGAEARALVKGAFGGAVAAALDRIKAAEAERRRVRQFPTLPPAPRVVWGRPTTAAAQHGNGAGSSHTPSPLQSLDGPPREGRVTDPAPSRSALAPTGPVAAPSPFPPTPSVSDERSAPTPSTALSSEDLSSSPPPPNLLFQYQAMDGQLTFLHPLCMRALTEHYGGAQHLPSHLTAAVLELEPLTMGHEVRRRFPTLAHLPTGARLTLCEVDLEGLGVGAGARVGVAAELDERARRRRERAKAEERRARKDEERLRREEERRRAPVIEDVARLPLPSASLLRHWEPGMDEPGAGEEGAGTSAEEPWGTSPEPGVSFAHIAKMGFAAGLNAPPPAAFSAKLGSSPLREGFGPALGASPPPLQGAWAPKREPGPAGAAVSALSADLQQTRTQPAQGPAQGSSSFGGKMPKAGKGKGKTLLFAVGLQGRANS